MELALVLPILLLIVFGIVDFGRMLNAQIALTEAAREGARAEALGADPDSRVEAAAGYLDGGVAATVETGCPGTDAVVRVDHTFTFITPIGPFLELYGGGMDGSVPMQGRGVMPCFE